MKDLKIQDLEIQFDDLDRDLYHAKKDFSMPYVYTLANKVPPGLRARPTNPNFSSLPCCQPCPTHKRFQL